MARRKDVYSPGGGQCKYARTRQLQLGDILRWTWDEHITSPQPVLLTLPRRVTRGLVREEPGSLPKKPSPHWYTSPRASTQAACCSCSARSRSATLSNHSEGVGTRTDSGRSPSSTCVLKGCQDKHTRVNTSHTHLFAPHTRVVNSASALSVLPSDAPLARTSGVEGASLCMTSRAFVAYHSAPAAAADTDVKTRADLVCWDLRPACERYLLPGTRVNAATRVVVPRSMLGQREVDVREAYSAQAAQRGGSPNSCAGSSKVHEHVEESKYWRGGRRDVQG